MDITNQLNMPLPGEESKKDKGKEGRNIAADVALGVLGGLSDAAQAVADLPRDIEYLISPPSPEEGEMERQRFFPRIETETMAGDFANTATQVVASLVGAGKFIKAAQGIGKAAKALSMGEKAVKAAEGAGAAVKTAESAGKGVKLAKGLGQGALADFMFFDADEERLMDTLVKIPGMDSHLTRYFASEGDESKIEARMKYALEGMFTGAAAEGVMFGLKAVKMKLKGGKAEELAEAAEKLTGDVDANDPSTVIKTVLREAADVDRAGIAAARIAADATDETISLTAKTIDDETAKIPEAKTASYAEFLSSGASKKLKNTIEAVSSDLAEDMKSIMGKGHKDIASDFSHALATNRQYVKLATGIKNKKLLTLMTEAVRDKVLPDSVPPIRETAKKLMEDNFEGEALDIALRLDASVMEGIAPRLLVYRMEDSLMANRLAFALKESLTAGTKEAEELADEMLADYLTHAARVQQIISNMGRGLSSLKTSPNKLINKKDFALKLKEAEAGASGVSVTKENVREIISGAGKKAKAADSSLGGIKDNDVLRAIKEGQPVRIDPEAMKAIRNMLSSGFDPHNKEHAAAMLSMFYTDNNALIRYFNGKKTGVLGSFKTYFVNNLLSSPATHAFNTMGSALKMFAVPAYRILGGMLEGNGDMIKRGVYQFAAYSRAVGDSLRVARAALKRGEAVLDYSTHYPATTAKRIGEDLEMRYAELSGIGVLNMSGIPGHVKGVINALAHLGAAGQMPLRVMGATDEFFKQMIYRSEVYAKAAVGSASGGRFSKEFYEKSLKEAFEPDGKARDMESLQSVREATWTQRLDGDGWLDKFGRQIKGIPGIGVFVPFITTPTNLLKDLAAHAPTAKWTAEYREAVKKGPEAVAVMKGKMAFGAMITFAGVQFAMSGRITGGYPEDPVARQVWQDLGVMPYSFKIGGSYIPYNRIDPFGAFFGICADFYDAARRGAEAAPELAGNIVSSVMKVITSKTYLTGLTDLLDFLDDPTSGNAAYLFGNLAAGFMPLSGLMRFTARGLDPDMKETRGLVDKFAAMAPGFSESVPSRYSWLTGKPMEYHYFKSDFDEDPVLRELAVQADAVRGGMPRKRVGGYELTGEEYSELCRIQGTIKIGGRTLYEALKSLVSSPYYQHASDEPDYRGISRKSKMISKVMSGYQDAAAKIIMARPDTAEAAKEHRRKRQVYQRQKLDNLSYDLSKL